MRTWLYDPKNDYEGRIFTGKIEIAAAKEAGWAEAPYDSKIPEGTVNQETLPSYNPDINELRTVRRIGRPKNAAKKGK